MFASPETKEPLKLNHFWEMTIDRVFTLSGLIQARMFCQHATFPRKTRKDDDGIYTKTR